MESQNKKLTPGFFFLTLGTIVTLVTSVVSFLNLVFSTLNKALPDVLNSNYQFGYNTFDFESIRGALATLIIAFPAYLILSYFWSKYTYTSPLSEYNKILRKWVIYLILFIVAVTCLVDLAILVKYFISGEITLRFILKVLTVLVLGALTGYYYMRELKRDTDEKPKKDFVFAIVAGVCVLVAVVYSFSIMGSPMKQRALRFDQRRLEDLQNIQSQVINYWQQKEKLPEKLTDLVDPLNNWQTLPRDPEFTKGLVYEYKKTADKAFELCATFTLPIPEGWREMTTGGMYPMATFDKSYPSEVASPSVYTGAINENWDHESGRTCFTRTIDPERYPPFPKPEPAIK